MSRGAMNLKNDTVDNAPKLRITQRDKDIITAVYHYRALETPQVETLCFTSNPENQHATKKTCQRRLTQLHQAGYLWRGEQASKLLTEGRKPYIYRINHKAVELLPELLDVEPEMISWRPEELVVGDLFLKHLLKTNDVRIAFSKAAENKGWIIQTWLDDRTLKSKQVKDYVTLTSPTGEESKAAIVPDGYCHLTIPAHDPDHQDRDPYRGDKARNFHSFFEVDLGTVTGKASKWGRRDWARKVKAYIEYFTSGLYQQRYGGLKYPKVLTITTTTRRLETLKTITEAAEGEKVFWFTTLDQVSSTTVLTKPIWQIATKTGHHSLIMPKPKPKRS